MVARHQIIWESLIIMHLIIHSFEIDTSWLLNLLKLLIFLKWLKGLWKRLLKVLTIWIRGEILVICKRLYKSRERERFGYFYYSPNNHKILHLFGLCLWRFMENLFTTHPTVITFMSRDVKALKGIFSIFPTAALVKFMAYLQIYHWISKHVFYSTEILC